MTLWLAGDQPRPGSVYTVWMTDGVGRADHISDAIADHIPPVRGAAADVTVLLNDAKLLQATATLANKFSPNAGGDISRSNSTTLTTGGTEVFRIPPRSDFLIALQNWDKAKKDASVANLFSEIRHPVLATEVPDPPEGARYVVTEVRRVTQFKYDVADHQRDKIGAGCQTSSADKACGTVNVGREITTSDGRVAHEPLVAFVSLKRIGTRSGNLYYDARHDAPAVIAGN